MISLTSANWGGSPAIPISFAYEKRRSGADMQYRAQVTVSALTGTSYFGYPIYLEVSIEGTVVDTVTLKTASPSQWSSAITYTTAWHTVPNKVSGTTAVKFRVYSGSGSSRNSTYTRSMGVDPAASTVSAPNGELSTTLKLTVTRYNSSFTHTIDYACGSVSGTVCTKSPDTTVEWNHANGNVLALARQNTTGQTVNVTFTITTYSGTSKIGVNNTTVTMAIPNGVKPSVAIAVEDAAGYLDTYDAYVQGWSKLKITLTPELAYDSPIIGSIVGADGKYYNDMSVITDEVRGKGTLRITAGVSDARNRTSDTAWENIQVLEYSKPSVEAVAYRCNSSGEKDDEGAYMRVGFTASIASLNNKNSANYTIRYGGAPITGTGTSYTSDPIACDVSQVVSVEVTVSDDLTSTTKAAVIPVAFTLMDFHNSGEGVSLGKVATRKGFDCAMPAYFTGGVNIGEQPLADHIVAQGITDGWAWRKWNSGVSECWAFKVQAISTVQSASYGNAYSTVPNGDLTLTFPSGLFVDAPVPVASCGGGGLPRLVWSDTNGGVSIKYNIITEWAMSANVYIRVHCLGKWK